MKIRIIALLAVVFGGAVISFSTNEEALYHPEFTSAQTPHSA